VLGTLSELRTRMETLRTDVDAVNAASDREPDLRVIFYMGQDLREDKRPDDD
jgi:hypothetical protein